MPLWSELWFYHLTKHSESPTWYQYISTFPILNALKCLFFNYRSRIPERWTDEELNCLNIYQCLFAIVACLVHLNMYNLNSSLCYDIYLYFWTITFTWLNNLKIVVIMWNLLSIKLLLLLLLLLDDSYWYGKYPG